MARSQITDPLQTHPFWLMDVAPIEPTSLPVFIPVFGFSSITGPELTLDIEEIVEANWPFRRKVVRGGSFSKISVSRGVVFYDSDFWRWIIATALGDTAFFQRTGDTWLRVGGVTPRRTLVLIHFFAHGYSALGAAQSALPAAAPAVTSVFNPLAPGPFEFASRVPARAFILRGCIPTRYKMVSDYDAKSAEISLMDLDMDVEIVEQISLSV